VAATVTEARLMADEDLAGTESVSVGASRRRMRDPLSAAISNQIAQLGG
jgi:hypothetical protein